MDWYGGKTGEETSPYIRTQLIANALQYWLSAKSHDNPAFIAGYDWQARSNWGKSYAAIRTEFEAHLLTSKRASSEKEAMVIARLFLPRFPTEFFVRDIPADLTYRSSIVWVNFVTGVNLIKAAEPGMLDRMTFEQLVQLPAQWAEGATAEQMSHIGLARLLPTLDWAATQGVITQKTHENYTQEDIDRALSELDKHMSGLNQAIIGLNEEPLKRVSIAKSELEKLLGTGPFISDGRKLARKDISGPINFRDPPRLKGKEHDYYSFLDVLASGKFDDQKRWLVTESDGTTISQQWIRMDEHRGMKTEGPWRKPGETWVIPPSPYTQLPDVKALFDKDFKRYLASITAAYETLIKSLFATLTLADRQALEFGEVKVYSLRKSAPYTLAEDETPSSIMALRARNGLILQSTYKGEQRFHELLPRAGVIRRLDQFDPGLIGGEIGQAVTHIDGHIMHTWREKLLPFDWDAHSQGCVPKDNARCSAIIERLGTTTFSAAPVATQNTPGVPLTLSSSRSVAVSHYIADQMLFVDPQALRRSVYGQTQFEREEAKGDLALAIGKVFIPFWGSIEDLTSGDRRRGGMGAIFLIIDVLSFGLPLGKFALGSVRLIGTAGRFGVRAAIPAFKSLTKELIISIVGALTPLNFLPDLLKALGRRVWRLGKFGLSGFNRLAGKTGRYNVVNSLPQIDNASRWRPLVRGDQLATVKGVDDVMVRNIAVADRADYRLLDPISSRPYGPALVNNSGELSLGRSHYTPLEKNNTHSIVELPENTQVREVLEVHGRTTLFLDDVPYRLNGDMLRRADLIDFDDTWKAIPCRVRRMPGSGSCQSQYVLRDPAPTPAVGAFDDSKGWAPWFGDSIYTPATNRTPMRVTSLAAHSTLPATMEFQKGIYGRVLVRVDVPGQELVDTFRVGATISEAIDGSKHYIFMRLNAGDFYVAERLKGQSVHDLLTFKKADTLPLDLKTELMTVYTGSLNANNMARIHGVSRVERALQAIEKIAVPIGGHANPPATLKHLKVDTSPGEAVLFDHSTRMIVRHSSDGAATWSSSRTAPQSVRETTADVLNTLFGRTVVTLESSVQGGPKALRIDHAMQDLQKHISKILRKPLHTPRNIAFAEIKTNKGVREVYVSVSGRKGDTAYLPLFSRDRPTGEVKVGDTSYFNIDHGVPFPETSLSVSHSGKVRAIPHSIDNIETYTPELTARPTSLDTESKLISVIRDKYPDPKELESITIGTTMAPCDSCAIVMKQFGYDGGPEDLDVIWK
jgi:hypothetical protein